MGRWLRPVLLVVLVASAVAVTLTVGVPPLSAIRAWVEGAGPAGPVLFAVLYAAMSLTPAPASVLSIGAGVLFGLAVGLPAVLLGALVGAVIGYAVARYLGRETVTRLGGERVDRVDDLLRRRGLLAVIGLRLVPLLPFTSTNLALGLTAVRPRDYLVGTAVGILPGACAYVTIGAYGAAPGSLPFVTAVGGLLLLAGTGVLVHRRRGVRERRGSL